MSEVGFYHLTRTTLEAALPRMLERTLERGQRAVVMAGSAERVEALNAWLWTYNDRAFLPHGATSDGHGVDQPIWLTERDERPNEADVLFLTDAARSERVAEFARCAVLFDGTDPETEAAARAHWRALKAAGHDLTYYRQDEAGRWARETGG